MLTAAVRDLHLCYPRDFLTDVRTSCMEIWEHNPFLTPLSEEDPAVEAIDCAYPLINRSNEAPFHAIHGFTQFLNDRLDLQISPRYFKGDIHLSAEERAWYSQVRELARVDIPFWLIAAGGKYDVTIKWWESRRYQEVVDHFRGRIQFVQVGASGHFHPKLEGVIDLRGRTNIRQLIRLVHHSQGVLCGVTSLMHLAAAVPTKDDRRTRPCVVVAGAREPAHWEAYPDHQFISTNGTLPCSLGGGCWRARTLPLGANDEGDRPENLCVDVVEGLPRCMEMISSQEVIRRIELYFRGGATHCLTRSQVRAAERAVSLTSANDCDENVLTLHNARLMCERFARNIPGPPQQYSGRGIVICGGGMRYFPPAWVCIRMLRKLGCNLPIELWHLGADEVDARMREILAPYDVTCVDATAKRKDFPVRRLGGWELKPYAIVHSRFREVLFLDADNMPVRNPEFLFQTSQYRQTGAIFWPDFESFDKSQKAWDICGLARPAMPEFESGQIVVDKARCWGPLRLALWYNENSDFFYEHLHGDKETFHLAFHKLSKSYGFVPTPAGWLPGTMCQHDFEGRRLFQHRNTDKWNLFLRNRQIAGFLHEEECRGFVRDLRNVWDGGVARFESGLRAPRKISSSLSIKACMISCISRAGLRAKTIARLRRTDWGQEPILLQLDNEQHASPQKRQEETAFLALQNCLRDRADFYLFLEDDLDFNRFIRHNLLSWRPLKERRVTLAGLYNPGHHPLACSPGQNFTLVPPHVVFGSQAMVISHHCLKFVLEHWTEVEGMQDLKLARLAGRVQSPLFFHTPSLVQHVGKASVWGGHFHQAPDFDPDWRA